MLRNRTLLAVSLAVCASFAGIGMIVPVRVLYAESRGASLAIIGAMASSYLISNFLFQYPSGWLADHWGRKPMMILSLAAQARFQRSTCSLMILHSSSCCVLLKERRRLLSCHRLAR